MKHNKFKETYKRLNPYIIAEIGVNHGGDIALAKKMIDQVASAGGHAAKFQTYKAEKIASKLHAPSYWNLEEESTTSQFELFKKYDRFEPQDYKELAVHCDKVGIDFLSTPFDLDSVDFLDELVPMFKIASADITNVPLLRKIGEKKKVVILSTGASTLKEIEEAVGILKKAGALEVILLHCVLNYPTPPENAHMELMNTLKACFGKESPIGYSDHVKVSSDGSMPALEVATLWGASVIEKHFTYDKSLPGNDHYHSMDRVDLKKFTEKISSYQKLIGTSTIRDVRKEAGAISNARRRIFFNKSLHKGDTLSEGSLITLRANEGIEASHWDRIVGSKLMDNVEQGQEVTWELINFQSKS